MAAAGQGRTADASTQAGSRSTRSAIPIIDTHIHLFDPRRPQGVPYAGPGAGPDRRNRLPTRSATAGSRGRSASSAPSRSKRARGSRTTCGSSRWPRRDTIIVGVVGNLEPDKPDFAEMFARYHKNPLFRGIRYGNLWGRDMTEQAATRPSSTA